jgi:competence protein ComGC
MMRPRLLPFLSRVLAPVALSLLVAVPVLSAQQNQPAQQDQHLVSPGQLQQQVQNTAATRNQNIDTLNQFVSSPQALKAMKDAKIDPVQVKTAIPTLSNADLANLSARAQRAQQDFAAGRLSNLLIALIIIAIVLIILLAAYH